MQWCLIPLAVPPTVNCPLPSFVRWPAHSPAQQGALYETPRSQTLKDIGRLCWAQPKYTPLAPQTWACLAAGTRRHQSDVCQLSWSVPTEYTLQHHHQHSCPHLVYLGTFWVWWEKWPITSDKSSARQHIYTLISNNEMRYLPAIQYQWLLCWLECMCVVCLVLTWGLHK